MAIPKPDKEFYADTLAATGRSRLTSATAGRIIRKLSAADPYALTKFEFSFKLSAGGLPKEARFLNIDADAFSCRGPEFFNRRLDLCLDIMRGEGQGEAAAKAEAALRQVAASPMDLYFGADVAGRGCLFAFWLIFGGVKRDGQAKFWPYDFDRLLPRLLKPLGMRAPAAFGRDMLNFGLDLGPEPRYKLYYLCRGKAGSGGRFGAARRRLDAALSGKKYFYFFSEMYSADGRLQKEKLFLEFLEDVRCGDKPAVSGLLRKLARAGYPDAALPAAALTLQACGGRVSLISLEADGTLTFYLRNR